MKTKNQFFGNFVKAGYFMPWSICTILLGFCVIWIYFISIIMGLSRDCFATSVKQMTQIFQNVDFYRAYNVINSFRDVFLETLKKCQVVLC